MAGSLHGPLRGPERLWIVAPCYHDVASFTILRQRTLEALRDSARFGGVPIQFVVVDDSGGSDEEVDSLRDLDDVCVITPPFNLGHQRALVCGLRLIEGELRDEDLVVTMDADGQDRPEDLERLLSPLVDAEHRRGTLVLARRTHRPETASFRALYLLFRLFFWSLTGATIKSGNFATYRGWLAKRMVLHPSFDLCYSSTLVSLGLPTIEVPCARGERYAGHSRMNAMRLFMHGIRMLMPFTDRIAIRALGAFSAVFGAGVVLAIVVVIVKISSSAAIPGWATATLLGVLTLSILALGNFIVLFVVFSHSRSISLANLESSIERPPRRSSSPTA